MEIWTRTRFDPEHRWTSENGHCLHKYRTRRKTDIITESCEAFSAVKDKINEIIEHQSEKEVQEPPFQTEIEPRSETSRPRRNAACIGEIKRRDHKIRALRDQNFRNGGTCNPHFNIFEESKMCHILTSDSTHHLIISGYIFLEEHYDILSDNFRIG